MPDADLRCPQCAAHIRSGSDWCTLCYADLRPAPAPAPAPAADLEPAPEPGPAPEPVADVPELAPVVDEDEDTDAAVAPAAPRGKHAKHGARPTAAEAEALAAQLLAQLVVEESGSPLGRYAGLTDTTGKKIVLMVGGAAGLALLAFALMALVGAFL